VSSIKQQYLAQYLFCCLNSLIKTQLSAKNTILLPFTLFFTLIASKIVTSDLVTALATNALLVMERFCY